MNYKKAVDKRLIRGRSIEGVAAASLYAACRQCGVPRTLDEIGQASRTGRKEIGRTYRFMVRELKMKIMPTGPEDYISRFCSGLGLDADVEAKAYELIKAAQEKELTSGAAPPVSLPPSSTSLRCCAESAVLSVKWPRSPGDRSHHSKSIQGTDSEPEHRT